MLVVRWLVVVKFRDGAESLRRSRTAAARTRWVSAMTFMPVVEFWAVEGPRGLSIYPINIRDLTISYDSDTELTASGTLSLSAIIITSTGRVVIQVGNYCKALFTSACLNLARSTWNHISSSITTDTTLEPLLSFEIVSSWNGSESELETDSQKTYKYFLILLWRLCEGCKPLAFTAQITVFCCKWKTVSTVFAIWLRTRHDETNKL